MIRSNNSVLLGRLAILPFAFLQWGIVLWYLKYLPRFPRNSLKRLLTCIIYILVFLGAVMAQLHLYGRITSTQRPTTDGFVAAVLIFENFFSVFLLFYISIKRRAARVDG
jgi:multisubunit Na+/H+ antiporter MnhE subunit